MNALLQSSANVDVLIFDQIDPERLVPSGIDTVIRDFVRHSGVRVGVVGITHDLTRPLGRWATADLDGTLVEFMPVARIDRTRPTRLPHAFIFLGGVARYRRSIRSTSRASVVHAHRMEIGYALTRLGFGPSVQFIHNAAKNLTGRESDSFWRHLPRTYRWIESRQIKRAARIVVFNKDEATRVSRLNPCTRRWTTWFDPDVYFVADDPERPKQDFLWIGRLDAQKDPLLAVEVAAELTRRGAAARLRMVGDGALRSSVTDRAQQAASINVEVLGPKNRPQVAELLRDSRALLMTSWYEGSPTVMIEALACGVPVIATVESDPDRILDSPALGSAVDGRNASSLADRLLAVEPGALEAEARLSAVRARSAPDSVRELVSFTVTGVHE